MAYVLKIKYENNLRRLTLQKGEVESESFSFTHLETRIRELFQLPAAAPLAITYTDEEEDVVTMGNDQDLKDALVEQELNPLRIYVTLSKSKDGDKEEAAEGKAAELDNADVVLKRLMRTLSQTPETVRHAFQAYEPLFQGVKSPTQIPGLVENVLQTIVTQVSSAVKNGSSAAFGGALPLPPPPPQYNWGPPRNGPPRGGNIWSPPPPPSDFLGPPRPSPDFKGPPRASSDVQGPIPPPPPSDFEGGAPPPPPPASDAPPAPGFGSDAPPPPPPYRGFGSRRRSQCPFAFGDLPAGAGSCSVAEGSDSDTQGLQTVHHGVTCDECGESPIVGNRWKSLTKFDYDLCSSCFQEHGNENEYTKIEQPKFRPRHMIQGLNRFRDSFHGMASPAWNPFHPSGPHGFAHGPHGHFYGGRHHGMRGSFGGRHHGGPPASDKLYARFVCDVTVFDGTEMAPATPFVKIWRLRNSGTLPWPANTSLEFVGGDGLGHVSSVPLEIPEQGLVPEAEMEAAVSMVAPEKPGRYVSHWRLVSPAGPKFGQRLSVIIQVVPKTSLDGIPAELVAVGDDAPAVEVESSAVTTTQTPAAELAEEREVTVKQDGPLTMFSFEDMRGDGINIPAAVEREHKSSADLVQKELLSATQSSDIGGGLISMVGDDAVNSAKELAAITEAGEKTVESDVLIPDSAQQQEGEFDSLFTLKKLEELKKLFAERDLLLAQELDEKKLGVEGDGKAAKSKTLEKAPAQEGSITYPKVQDEGLIPYPVVETETNEGLIPYPVVDTTTAVASPAEGDNLSTSKALLAKLEAMGFTDAKLNFELLEKNDFDLRKTLDDLCAAEEWDPILEELEEMGFYDTVMNRRLMFKNNGSVKRVVKELVQMYRDIQGKREKVE